MRNNLRKSLLMLPVIVLIVAAFTTAVFATGDAEAVTGFYNTAWALLPPVIAIALALITKEVYSSLFIGIIVGGLLYGVLQDWAPEKCMQFGWATGALVTTMTTDYGTPVEEGQVWSIYKGNARVKR